MSNEHLLDLSALRTQQGAGLQLEDGLWPWVILGPIETAEYMDLHEQIEEIRNRNQRTTVEDAREQVRLMREMLALILPTMPPERQSELSDAEVDHILRFFEIKRWDDQGDQLEEVTERVEKQAVAVERMKKTGMRMTTAAADVDELNRKMRRTGAE